MDLVNKLSDTALKKRQEILNILQGMPIKDAEAAINSALYYVETCLDEQKKTTVFYDNQIVNNWFGSD